MAFLNGQITEDIYILNTLTDLVNLKNFTASLKVFIALSSHPIYNIKLFITSL